MSKKKPGKLTRRSATSMTQLGSHLRQRGQPREFRIAPPLWEAQDLVKFLEASMPRGVETAAKRHDDDAELRSTLKSYAEIATGLWRLRRRMTKQGTDEPLPEMQRVFRHLVSVYNALEGLGLEVQDHDNTDYQEGMIIHVVEAQPTPGIERQRILETLRPSVYWNKKMIQMGEVIVATPLSHAAGDSGGAGTDSSNSGGN